MINNDQGMEADTLTYKFLYISVVHTLLQLIRYSSHDFFSLTETVYLLLTSKWSPADIDTIDTDKRQIDCVL